MTLGSSGHGSDPGACQQRRLEASHLAARSSRSFKRRIEGARGVGAYKASMLQDVEAGRSLEIEALIGSVMEMGRLTGTPCPHIGAVYACARPASEGFQHVTLVTCVSGNHS
jgi:2-dehydropantoate 2-reductase